MSTTIDVEAARIPDRDQLLEQLRSRGLDARPHDELGIEVPCGEDDPGACDEVFAQVEAMIMDLGAQMIPIKHESVIYVRPPVG